MTNPVDLHALAAATRQAPDLSEIFNKLPPQISEYILQTLKQSIVAVVSTGPQGCDIGLANKLNNLSYVLKNMAHKIDMKSSPSVLRYEDEAIMAELAKLNAKTQP